MSSVQNYFQQIDFYVVVNFVASLLHNLGLYGIYKSFFVISHVFYHNIYKSLKKTTRNILHFRFLPVNFFKRSLSVFCFFFVDIVVNLLIGNSFWLENINIDKFLLIKVKIWIQLENWLFQFNEFISSLLSA